MAAIDGEIYDTSRTLRFFFCFSLLLLQGGGSTLIPDRRKVALHDHKGLHRMLILLNVEKMRLLVYEWGSDEKENK